MALLQVDQLVHSYKNRHFFQRKAAIPALRNVSFSIEEGTCFGLMGTSGAGKSTLGKVILGIQPPQEGTVFFQGTDLYATGKKERREMRRNIQTVFQDSYSAVNPRMTAEDIIAEPLDNFEPAKDTERRRIVIDLLERVGLEESDLKKYPHEFSGGQLQRINIARAISIKPKLIVLDESVSSLDMVTKTVILELLSDLKKDLGVSYLFITHDVKAACFLSDRLGVLEKGELVDTFSSKDSFLASRHPAVEKMLASTLSDHPADRSIRGAKPLVSVSK